MRLPTEELYGKNKRLKEEVIGKSLLKKKTLVLETLYINLMPRGNIRPGTDCLNNCQKYRNQWVTDQTESTQSGLVVFQ